MKNKWYLKVIVFLVFVLLINVFNSEAATIKIGAILPLTGEGTPDQGQASQMAIMLAVDELNSKGGINGKKIEVIFEDSQCQAQKGVISIRKLIDIDKVDFIIGDICDSVTAAIMPIAEEKRKVLITPGSTSPSISHAGEFIFRFWFSENDLGGQVAEYAYKKGYRKMAIIYINNAWGFAQKNGVSNRFNELGGKIVSMQAIDPDNVDFRTELLKAEKKDPHCYYIGLHPNGLVLTMKQMKEQGLNRQVFSHGGLVGSTQTLGLGGDNLEGIIAPFVYDASSDFRDRFFKKFGVEPGITADSSYDAVMLVAKILNKTDKSDSDTIKNGLCRTSDYKGVSGLITVDDNGDVHRPLRLMIVKNGKLIPYED